MTELGEQGEDIELFLEYIRQKIAIEEAKISFLDLKQQQKEDAS